MGGSGVEFRQYYRAVVKRLWLVLLLAAVIAVGVYWRITSQPPKYSATAKVMLTTNNLLSAPTTSTNLTGTSSGGSSGKADSTVINGAIAVITSRPVAQRVAKDVGIKVGDVQKSLSAEKVAGTNMIAITATSANRELAPKVVNAAARHFVAYFRDANRRDYHDIRLFIASQLTQARDALEVSDQQIQQAKERYAFVDLTAAIGQASSELAATRDDMEETRLRIREDKAKIDSAVARLGNEKISRVYSTEVEDNPVYEQLQSRLTELEVERAELSQRYTARHPKMIQVEGSIGTIKAALVKETRTIVGREVNSINPIHDQLLTEIATLQGDRAAATARLAALGVSLRSRQSAVAALPSVERRLNSLTRENAILNDSYALLAERHQEAVLRENEAGFVPAGVQVMEPGVLPAAPLSARVPLFTGAGALIGVLLGAIAAIVLESSDDKIRSAQDAERTLGAPVLAQVPDMAPQRTAPGGTMFLVALLLTVMLGGTLVAARATTPESAVAGGGAASILVRLGRSLDGLTARVSQVIR